MDAAPYFAPTYFPAPYFYLATVPTPVSSSTSTAPMPYDAPSYFPASYFYNTPTSSSASSPSGVTPYNAPTYFPSAYFYGNSSPSVVPTPPLTPTPSSSTTLESFAALLALVRETGAFEDVIFGASTRRSQAGADTYPLAVVTFKGWEEDDEVDPISIIRRTMFSITIVVKSEDDLPRFDLLDGLSSAIKRMVDRSDLGGTCLPALTWIGSGRYDYSGHYPEQSIDLEGGFSSILDPTAIVPVSS